MRLSKLMKKILLSLLKTERTHLSILDMVSIFEPEAMKIYHRPRYHVTVKPTRAASYKRALRSLEKWNLVKRRFARMAYGWRGYELTQKGLTLAREIRDEINRAIKDYGDLI